MGRVALFPTAAQMSQVQASLSSLAASNVQILAALKGIAFLPTSVQFSALLQTSNGAILAALQTLISQGANQMSALTDLQTAVAGLSASTSAEIAAVAAALSNNPSAADVEASVTQLNTLKASLDKETASLTTPPATS